MDIHTDKITAMDTDKNRTENTKKQILILPHLLWEQCRNDCEICGSANDEDRPIQYDQDILGQLAKPGKKSVIESYIF